MEPMQVAFFLAGEITQVEESIPWVRCASGHSRLSRVLMSLIDIWDDIRGFLLTAIVKQ